MRVKLHWQILLAILLGVIFGINFPTTYKITDDTITKLEAENISQASINILKTEKKEFEETKETFLNNLHTKIDANDFKKYETQILEASKHNLFLPYISWMGELFLRALSMLIVPLIIGSIISGVANIMADGKLLKIGMKTVFYYLSTGFLAIITGFIFVSIIKPGIGINVELNPSSNGIILSSISLSDTIKNIIPINIFASISEGHILSILFFSILFGYFITRIPEKYKVFLIKFFNAFFEVMMKITNWVIKFTPFGMLGIMAVLAAETDNLLEIVQVLSKYVLTVVIALFFHSTITLPFIIKFMFHTNPWKYYKIMQSAIFTAFVTSSSLTTLPLTMNVIKKRSGVSDKISGFTLPMGTTLNIDGTAIYQLISVFFIAQAYGVDLSILEIIIVCVTTLIGSIGAGSIPLTSVVIMSVILKAVGLPIEGISIIISLDFCLSMLKSSVNVWSDSCGAVIIAKSEGEKLRI